MKGFIKIVDSQWVADSNIKMIHKDERGRLFLGPPVSYTSGQTIIVEVSDTLSKKDGYYHIIKVIGAIGK